MKEFAVIVAGGTGQRMNSSTPKQFLLLAGEPVLFHTIRAFHSYSKELEIIVVLPGDQRTTWDDLQAEYNFAIPHSVVDGGNTRTESVKNGLSHVADNALVAIHDGVRPMIDSQTIANSFSVAKESGSAVVAVAAKDSIRKMSEGGESEAVDRSRYRLVQTPQTFQSSLIKSAYALVASDNYTDDASVLEAAGHPITLIEGNYRNIKITTPEDIAIAQALINSIS